MRRFAVVFTLICLLSFPALGGHRPVGDRYCACGTVGCLEDYPGECGGALSAASNQTPNSNDQNDATSELGVALLAVLLWLRLKA